MMIPKGGGTDFRGIGLVDVPWKAISGIINDPLPSSIQFHDALHGFRAGRGTGTATLEAKLLQKLTSTRETFLHAILLEIHKDYDDLERDRSLDIQEGYGVGPMTIRTVQIY